jgi:hypothetical protein
MTLYNVHIYREMRLFFPGIGAETPEDAARFAADKLTEDAEYTEDCQGENLAALVDVVGDDEFEHSVTIDFDHERMRKAAPQLLEALKDLLGDLPSVRSGVCQHCGREYDDIFSGECPSDDCPSFKASAAIAQATAIHQPTIERKQP